MSPPPAQHDEDDAREISELRSTSTPREINFSRPLIARLIKALHFSRPLIARLIKALHENPKPDPLAAPVRRSRSSELGARLEHAPDLGLRDR